MCFTQPNNRYLKVSQTLRKNSKSLHPYYSVFRTDNKGNFYKLYFGQDSITAAKHAIEESSNPISIGVECRVDGFKVEWN